MAMPFRFAALLLTTILLASHAAGQGLSPAALLESRIPEVAFDETPVSEVFAFLGQYARTNVVVRWEALASFGIERDAPVSLRVRNLRFGQVMWLVLNQVRGDGPPLAYRLDRNLLLISTEDDLGQELITRVYDVNDLIMPLEQVNPTASFGRERQYVSGVTAQVAEGAVGVQPQIGTLSSGVSLWGPTSGIFQSGGAGGQGASIFQGDGGQEDGEDDSEARREENMNQLVQLITSAVEPDSWDVNGGRGTVRTFRGMLVIRNTPLVHQQIGGPITR
jgi:hypothetical protein